MHIIYVMTVLFSRPLPRLLLLDVEAAPASTFRVGQQARPCQARPLPKLLPPASSAPPQAALHAACPDARAASRAPPDPSKYSLQYH